MLRPLLASLVLMFLPAAAFAQVYAIGELGYARADFPLGEPYNGRLDDNTYVYGFDVGFGFRKFAVEVGANSYGSLDGTATPCATGTICAPIVVSVPNNDQNLYKFALVRRFTIGRMQAYGKGGYYRANVKTNIELPDSKLKVDGLLLAGGVRWNFGEHPWSVGVEVARYDDNVSQFTVGFGWRTTLLGN